MRFFHYTTADGLVGIVSKKTIWASEVNFQKDMMEMKEAYRLFLELHTERFPAVHGIGELITLSRIQPILEGGSRILPGVFVASFIEEEGNKLSQWRGYCPRGGFSIGFDEDYLMSRFGNKDEAFSKCLYDREQQKKLLADNVIPILEEAYGSFPDGAMTVGDLMRKMRDHDSVLMKLNEEIARVAPVIKHEKFSEEVEWRVIHQGTIEGHDVCFRPGSDFPIPYVELPIDVGQIKQIAIGPTPDLATSTMAIAALLKNKGLNHVIISNDMIPLRM